MPASRSASREYWSVPALIDWMKASRGAAAISSLRHKPETSSTSALPMRAFKLVEAAHLEPVETGVAQGEALAHAIGGVGETDRELVSAGSGRTFMEIASQNRR